MPVQHEPDTLASAALCDHTATIYEPCATDAPMSLAEITSRCGCARHKYSPIAEHADPHAAAQHAALERAAMLNAIHAQFRAEMEGRP